MKSKGNDLQKERIPPLKVNSKKLVRFQLFDILNDPSQKIGLSNREPDLFEKLKAKLIASHRKMQSKAVGWNGTHPVYPDQSSPVFKADITDQDDFEFIELTNTKSTPLDLTSLAFTSGIQLDFGSLPISERLLPGNGRLLPVRNRDAFALRFGAIQVAGEYFGSLSNSGETLTLSLGANPYLGFTFNDKSPWPKASPKPGRFPTIRQAPSTLGFVMANM